MRLGDASRRLRAALIVMAMVLSLFVGRLVQLQGLDASAYAAEAESKRLQQDVPIPAQRGDITDVNGVALATTVDAINVTADQLLIAKSKNSGPAVVASALAPLLGLDAASLTQRLTGIRRFVYVQKAISPATWRAITELPARERVGIVPQDVGKRVYPSGALAANVIGFLGADGRPLGGLERSSNALLAGRDGKETFEQTKGQRLPLGESSRVQPVNGQDLTLTLDADLQWKAQSLIAAKVKEANAVSGDVVVMDVTTGKVLALATAPTFDANDPGRAAAEDRGNRPLSDVFEPGSTSKVMTMSAVIEEGLATPDTIVTIPGQIIRGGKTFHDDVAHGTWHLTLTGVLAKSSNIGTIEASEQMKDTTLAGYLAKFGIGQPTGLGFPGESRGILADPKDWSASQRYTVRFGQGLSLTTLQAAAVFASIGNGGVRVEPSLVERWTDPAGKVHTPPAPKKVRVVSAETAKTVRSMMEAVVAEGGTAPRAQIPGYRVAGKTGTANRVVDGHYSGYTASFIGLAPADKPRYVVAVILQGPKNGHFGGTLAAPVFKEVMSFALKSARVPPTGSKRPTMKLSAD